MTASTTVTSVLRGTPVVPGMAYGPVIWPGAQPALDQAGAPVEEAARPGEEARFVGATQAVAERIRARATHATGAASEVLAATAALVQDRGWTGAALKLIRAGEPAPQAAAQAIGNFTAKLARLGGLMAERVTDLNDIRGRVVAELLGQPEPGIPRPEVPSVLLADDLAPADTAGLDPAVVLALVTEHGGPTSHTAIIARQLGIPCVVAVTGLGAVQAGAQVLVDGAGGAVTVNPDPVGAAELVAASRAERAAVAGWAGPGRTADGHTVAVLANVQDGESARAAASTAAEGVGLFRTELAFLDRDTEPGADEQTAIYGEVLRAFDGRKVVIRTLDAGSDKPLRFVETPAEANPALGVRGIRIADDHPALLDRQLDAIAAAAAGATLAPWVMAPMIATVAEAARFAGQVRARGLTPGVMIEVPAAALLADRLLEHVEFLSIGTNDLTQYTMAADRMSSPLAALTDPWQPAVLALVRHAAAAGARRGKPVGVCGEAAADPLLACVLVGLGVTSLSAAAAAVPAVGARLAEVTLAQCEKAAEAAVDSTSPAEARERAAAALGRA